MLQNLILLARMLAINSRDMLPVVLVIMAFQYWVIRQPFADIATLLLGAAMVLVGLTLFMHGMSMSLFPLGESLVRALAYRGNVWLLAVFAFSVGAGSTVAEPALIAVTSEAARAVFFDAGTETVRHNALVLRLACAVAVGIAVTLGVFFVVKGWSTARLVLAGYLAAMLVSILTRTPLSAIALDAGAAATSAINIPLISAMGVGLASMIKGRNPVLDGFGLVALCSIMPTVVVLLGSQLLR